MVARISRPAANQGIADSWSWDCRFSRSSTACLSRMLVMGRTLFPGLGDTLIGTETVA
jgi:hypothetical protein